MIPITELYGFIVLTAINRGTGEATSETYALKSASEDPNGTQRLVGTSEDGDDFAVSVRPLGAVPPEVEPYRKLIVGLIAADEQCAMPGCSVTLLGHLLAPLDPELVELVRAEDPNER